MTGAPETDSKPAQAPQPSRNLDTHHGDAHDPDTLDRQALERVAAGDIEAFSRLVDRHQDRLMRVCQGFLHDPEEARDAVQEILVKAFRKAGSYKPRGKVYTWLYRIAVNHCLNKLRRRKIVSFFSLASGSDQGTVDGLALDPADESPGPGERLATRERWARTRRALVALPEGQRTAVILTKLEGLSQKQVAEVLRISEGAVESRLFRAMRKLETVLEEDPGGGG